MFVEHSTQRTQKAECTSTKKMLLVKQVKIVFKLVDTLVSTCARLIIVVAQETLETYQKTSCHGNTTHGPRGQFR